ncbi:uncharacterized protein LOC113798256 [Dermatophagoides pteronyssinus]|uniref:uncharacterized protein LOC113798256 n=1 Tax=Dermatophagoides pteronyssinus TaxID=6956 RepID=UPI003F665D7A
MLISNMRFIYVFYLILLITTEIQTDNEMIITATQKDIICENLKQYKNGSKFNILAIGTTSKRFLLITKDSFVYDAPIHSLDRAHDQLYLRTKPTLIKDKYPILFKNPVLTNIRARNKISNAFLVNDGKNDWIFFNKRQGKTMLKVHYNIDTSEMFTESVQSNDKNEVIVSSNKPRHYYSIVNVNNNLYINIGQYDSDFKNMSIIPSEGDKYLICLRTNTTIWMEKGIKCRSAIPVQWPILKGFVTNNKFYLFGHSCIYIFDEDAYNNQGKEYPLQKNKL